MVDSKEIFGETAHGGVRTVIVFMDDNENVVDEEEATMAYLTEYDEHDNLVFSETLVAEK